jgi:pyoverdine/dityrosine biosynthesis protein Dit1
MRAVFFTLDGLRSVPEEIGNVSLSAKYRRAVKSMVRNFEQTDINEISSIKPTREYEYTKTVEWFDGQPVHYFCEVEL